MKTLLSEQTRGKKSDAHMRNKHKSKVSSKAAPLRDKHALFHGSALHATVAHIHARNTLRVHALSLSKHYSTLSWVADFRSPLLLILLSGFLLDLFHRHLPSHFAAGSVSSLFLRQSLSLHHVNVCMPMLLYLGRSSKTISVQIDTLADYFNVDDLSCSTRTFK